MIAAATRVTLQVRIHRILRLDDIFLLFACVCQTGGTIFVFLKTETLYFNEEIGLNPGRLTMPTDIVGLINSYKNLYYAYPTLAWTTIFFVKFAYIAFFRHLVARLKGLTLYWKVLTAITIISYPICVLTIYVVCPKRGLEARMFVVIYFVLAFADVNTTVVFGQPSYLQKSLAVAILDIVLDVATDIMSLQHLTPLEI